MAERDAPPGNAAAAAAAPSAGPAPSQSDPVLVGSSLSPGLMAMRWMQPSAAAASPPRRERGKGKGKGKGRKGSRAPLPPQDGGPALPSDDGPPPAHAAMSASVAHIENELAMAMANGTRSLVQAEWSVPVLAVYELEAGNRDGVVYVDRRCLADAIQMVGTSGRRIAFVTEQAFRDLKPLLCSTSLA